MFCRWCGTEAAPGDRFCGGCGTALAPRAPVVGAAVPVSPPERSGASPPSPSAQPLVGDSAAPPVPPVVATTTAAIVTTPNDAATRSPLPGRVKNWVLLTLGGAGLMIFGCLLPWASQNNGLTTQTVSGISAGGGQVSIVLGIIIAVLAALFWTGKVGKKNAIATLVLGALGTAISVANMANVSDVINQEKRQTGGLVSGVGTKMGAGLLLLLVGCVVVVVGSIMTLIRGRSAPVPQ
jgi:hypothetical protein